jgi:hypothetical protein
MSFCVLVESAKAGVFDFVDEDLFVFLSFLRCSGETEPSDWCVAN